jgi:hypothetical protein
VCDANQKPYYENEVELKSGKGDVTFTVAGALGAHYVYLIWPDEKNPHSRYVNFRVDCDTFIETGDKEVDRLYVVARDLMTLGRREFEMPRGRLIGYASGDTTHFDGITLRDLVYSLPACKYWERDMQCSLDRFLEAQAGDGMIPDGIERDGRTWRVGMASDTEYVLTLGVWQTWMVTGDNAWLESALPRLERALRYAQTDGKRWDAKHKLVKRQHSCDTWDLDMDGAEDKGEGRHVIATCDQSGYYLAFQAMGLMHKALGHEADAQRWAKEAEEYRQRAVALLWDGRKFLHHVHLDQIDHGDFNENEQLAMGNVWAASRGLASPDQARRIVDEYRRRHKETGGAYPWWSLQPGYPDSLNYFPSRPFCAQGGFANGGLMPWVGGELCRAAFACGREAYAMDLLREYVQHVRKTGGVHAWYWPNGEAGFRTPNEVPYAGWGMAQWVEAFVEGLAGIEDVSGRLRHVRVSPRWAIANANNVKATARYGANGCYFMYRTQTAKQNPMITLTFTGSGETADFRVLLPAGWKAKTVQLNGKAIEFKQVHVDRSRFATFTAPIAGASKAVIVCEKPAA